MRKGEGPYLVLVLFVKAATTTLVDAISDEMEKAVNGRKS
jgi:hypothetical protein